VSTVTAYKAFNADLTCRGHQYVEGETYEHDGAVSLCNSGYHACLQPLHVLRYYRPGTSVFHVVELEGVSPEREDDSKVAARKITVGAKISLAGLIEAQVEYVTSRAKPVKGSTTKADNGAATASGWSGAATASGESGAATASGESGAATASGWSGAATASGESGAATASGWSGAATASGWSGAATASGRYGAATASGGESIAVVTGKDGRARGVVGAWIVLTERDVDWHIVEVRAVHVDGEQVKADTFYTLRGGEVVEVTP
jgi:hypothetical protein